MKIHAQDPAARAVLLIALIATACGRGGGESGASISTPTPTLQSSATPTIAVPTPLPDSGVIPPGTYVTNFQPKVTFNAASAGWEVDVETPGWIGMEFPLPDHVLATLSIVAVEKVFDPRHEGKLIDPPDDLADWIGKLPGLKLVAPPTLVTVGGIEGKQLDVLIGPDNVGVGPISGAHVGNGFFKNGAFRIIVVSVDGQDVQISFAPDEVGSEHFDAAVSLAQPLIDSITWG